MLIRTLLATLMLFMIFLSEAQTPSSVTHTVGRGDTLYGIVAEYYPERMARWTDVAAEIVALNPDAFPQGMDTVMNLGDVLILVEYEAPPRSAYTRTTTDTDGDQPPRDTSAKPVVASGSLTTESAPASDTGTAQTADTEATLALDNAAPGREAIGRVMSVTGRSIAIDHQNEQRPLELNEYVYLGDAITTDVQSALTVQLIDTAVVTLQPSSRLMFERYQYDADKQRGSAIMTLVKGGFRTKTGLLGEHHPEAIAVNTAVATVGVRGTEFALRVCAPESCRVNASSAMLGAGLYAGVLEGAIVLSNNTGNLETRQGEFYRVAAPNTIPEPAVEAAGLLFESEELTRLNVKIEKEQPLSFLGWLKRKLFGD